MRKYSVCGALLLALVISPGCSTSQLPAAKDPAVIRMKALATLYGGCVSQNGGHLPADENALRAYIRTKGTGVLSRHSVKNVDDLFVSLRDGKPLAISYGKDMPNREITPGFIVAHERNGVGGKRLVAFPNAAVAELDQSAFEEVQAANTKEN